MRTHNSWKIEDLHQGGYIFMITSLGVSFHTPSLFEAITLNVYFPSLKFV